MRKIPIEAKIHQALTGVLNLMGLKEPKDVTIRNAYLCRYTGKGYITEHTKTTCQPLNPIAAAKMKRYRALFEQRLEDLKGYSVEVVHDPESKRLLRIIVSKRN